MSVFLCLVIGAFVGWIGSLVMRTNTSVSILVDIACGAVAAIGLALLLATDSTFDSIVAGYLGSVIGLVLLTPFADF